MAELQDYLTDKSGSWSVGDEHLTLLAGFLANKDNKYAPNVPLLTLQILRGELGGTSAPSSDLRRAGSNRHYQNQINQSI